MGFFDRFSKKLEYGLVSNKSKVYSSNSTDSNDIHSGEYFKEALKTEFELNPNSKMLQSLISTTSRGSIIPHNANFRVLESVYDKVSYISRIINMRASFALQCGYTIEAETDEDEKKLNDMISDVDLYNTLIGMQLWGTFYWYINKSNELRLLNPKNIWVLRDGFDITGYIQAFDLTNASDATFIPEKDIVQFNYNSIADNAYGNSLIKNSLTNLDRLLQIEKDIANIIANQAAPIVHYKVGTNDLIGTQGDVDKATEYINNLLPGSDLITTNMITSEVINALPSSFNPEQYINYYWDRVLGGLIPPVMMGMDEGANKATARVQIDGFEKDIKSLQMQISYVLKKHVFPRMLGKKDAKVSILWGEMDQEDQLTRDTRLDMLTRAGIPIKTAMKMVGLTKYVDEVPEESERKDDTSTTPGEAPNPKRKSFGDGPEDTDTKDE